jgi:hypothetical protein
MIHEKGYYRRYAVVGVGGWSCSCCAPAPGKAKKLFLKMEKRSERITWRKELRKELQTVNV